MSEIANVFALLKRIGADRVIQSVM